MMLCVDMHLGGNAHEIATKTHEQYHPHHITWRSNQSIFPRWPMREAISGGQDMYSRQTCLSNYQLSFIAGNFDM